jgi:hypothetical protein
MSTLLSQSENTMLRGLVGVKITKLVLHKHPGMSGYRVALFQLHKRQNIAVEIVSHSISNRQEAFRMSIRETESETIFFGSDEIQFEDFLVSKVCLVRQKDVVDKEASKDEEPVLVDVDAGISLLSKAGAMLLLVADPFPTLFQLRFSSQVDLFRSNSFEQFVEI